MSRWILAASPSSCIAAREPWPGMTGTYHGNERRLFAKTFATREAAEQWALARDVEPYFRPEELL